MGGSIRITFTAGRRQKWFLVERRPGHGGVAPKGDGAKNGPPFSGPFVGHGFDVVQRYLSGSV